MENSEIIKPLKLAAALLELHDANPFKIRNFTSAIFKIDNSSINLSTLSLEELEKQDGLGKSIALKVSEILAIGTFEELNELLEKTPKGVVEMLNIKGIGPKKIKTIWQDLKIESIKELLLACNENKVAALKGFGEKTQETIKANILFIQEHENSYKYAEAFHLEKELIDYIIQNNLCEKIESTGDIRRNLDILDKIEFIAVGDVFELIDHLDQSGLVEVNKKACSPYIWKGNAISPTIPIEIQLVDKADFGRQHFISTGSSAHLNYSLESGKTVLETVNGFDETEVEASVFQKLGAPFILPEMREGQFEWKLAKENNLPKLVKYTDLKGILHNHSTYSDGKNTLEEMAVYCKELGYEYLGISDHSVSAFYAKGLEEERIIQQHQEIDELNKKLAPFKIFKGIESDILNDGSLDYSESVLKSFDFIVASIHSNLNMDINKATNRLLRAIENPYTTILGHPTGRLLLRRAGYPIDHKTIIDACAEHNVIIEINANPWRLDIDWRWVHYCIEKGVMLSINPDAHKKDGYHDMYFGWLAGRKGGLTKEMTFNALSLQEIESYLQK